MNIGKCDWTISISKLWDDYVDVMSLGYEWFLNGIMLVNECVKIFS